MARGARARRRIRDFRIFDVFCCDVDPVDKYLDGAEGKGEELE